MPTTTVNLLRTNDWSLLTGEQWLVMALCLAVGAIIALAVERIGRVQ